LKQKTITVGPGNNFSQIEAFVAKESNGKLVAASHGVGIYGWTAGGGHGYMTRMYGLGVDALLNIDLILANYSIITASATRNKELFRAIRGSGGGAYGIAISLTVQLFDNPGKVSTFVGVYALRNQTAIMFGNWIKSVPNQAFAYFFIDITTRVNDTQYNSESMVFDTTPMIKHSEFTGKALNFSQMTVNVHDASKSKQSDQTHQFTLHPNATKFRSKSSICSDCCYLLWQSNILFSNSIEIE
jgi:FAD/FMN-containing dehydrogenase